MDIHFLQYEESRRKKDSDKNGTAHKIVQMDIIIDVKRKYFERYKR